MVAEKLTLMEMAIIDAMRQEGMIERADVGKYCRTIISDWDAPGPTLWTEATVRQFADTLDGLVEKGYLAWKTYILQVELTEKGKKYIADNKKELDNLPQVDESTTAAVREWFKQQKKKMVL